MSAFDAEDERFMRRALALAGRGAGRVEPNPMVGCVIVRRGRVIGEGYHRQFGGPHAEIVALRRCTTSPAGATVYATLEPCCHIGKTGPCTRALLDAGVGRVVAACSDPNPQVHGRGFRVLRSAGVRVDVGLLRDVAHELNAPFFKLVHTRRPWVILKWAQSLDGKIATHTGDAKWISDDACRAHAHRIRGGLDAIVVGIGTVLQDDPLLTCRVGRVRRVATRVVLDSTLRTPLNSQLVKTARETATWIFCRPRVAASRARRLEQAGCVVRRVKRSRTGLDLAGILDHLGGCAMTNVLVEGGGGVLGSFLDAGLADELHVYVAPRLIGGVQAPGPLAGVGAATVDESWTLPHLRPQRIGNGLLLRARLRDV